jgi:nitrite reductase (NADH) large subunit
VTYGELRTAWADGHRSSKQLRAATGAGAGCGSCAPLLAEIAGEVATGRKAAVGWGLPAAASAVLVLLVAAAAFGPIPMARSVLETPSFDFLWRDGWWKQVTGFSLLGLIASALLLPARERLPAILRSTFPNERIAHATIGVATVLALGVHTGLRMGVNLNAILMSCMIGLMALGGLTGLATSAERRLPSRLGTALRMSWKRAHVGLFLPIPVLVLFHVLAVYYY